MRETSDMHRRHGGKNDIVMTKIYFLQKSHILHLAGGRAALHKIICDERIEMSVAWEFFYYLSSSCDQSCTIHGDQPAGPAGPRGDGRAGWKFWGDWTIRAVRVPKSCTHGPGEYQLARNTHGTGGSRTNPNGFGRGEELCGAQSNPNFFRQMSLLYELSK